MTFKEYMRKFEGIDTPKGDLAEDMRRDERFPDENSREAIFSYLKSRGACGEALAVFRRAWKKYSEAAEC